MSNYNSEGSTLVFTGDIPTEKAEALALSIEKWETIALCNKAENRIIRDGCAMTCGLCMLYPGYDCAGCPVADAGHVMCSGTPYFRYIVTSTVEDAVEAAEAEVAFLKSLQ